MKLDVTTMYFCVAVASACCATAMYYVWQVHHREPALHHWMLGFALSALGSVLAVLGDMLPVWLARGLANTIAVASCTFLYSGTVRFIGRPGRWGLLAAVYVPAFAANLYFATVADSMAIRVTAYSVAASFTCLLMAWELLFHMPADQRRVARGVAGCWVIYSIAALLRLGAVLQAGRGVTLQTIGPIQNMFFAVLLAVLIMATTGHLLLTSQRLQLRLDLLANRDELTGLLNRRAFQAQAAQAAAAAGTGRRSVLMVADIDHFKRINDRYGHLVGDLVLRSAARTLEQQLREDDVLARAGGEEFWILAPRMDAAAATALAERLRAAVEADTVTVGAEKIRYTISIGLAEVDTGQAEDGLHEALAAADAAMYAAKAGGRNLVSLVPAAA